MSDDPKIRKGLAPKTDPICYQTTRDIILPAGTILRQAADERGGKGHVETPIGFGDFFTGHLVVQIHPDAVASGIFKKVIA